MKYFQEDWHGPDKRELTENEAIDTLIRHKTHAYDPGHTGQLETLERTIDGLQTMVKMLIEHSPNKEAIIRQMVADNRHWDCPVTIEEGSAA